MQYCIGDTSTNYILRPESTQIILLQIFFKTFSPEITSKKIKPNKSSLIADSFYTVNLPTLHKQEHSFLAAQNQKYDKHRK